ncbi:MAG: S-layer homology domain-containing protein [Acidaminococcus fermentans]|uniref:S-layer homology domain-containing protein n=1 Tax=Acidaminococcus fermentans TaxID=905 RepID=UPI00242F4AF3|nr:S-layer homology domain-containing protein [Acidaminococcus fermentans]MCI7194646.1 S-layer homology domain-containing protein [Acidaminococcus fermentans]
MAVGYSSSAESSAVAIGDTATAAENAIAIGKETEAAKNAVAIGKNTKASVEGSIALGKDSQAIRPGGITGWDPKTGTTSTKSGTAWVSGAGALSIGNGGTSRQITNVAAGSEDSDAVNLAQLKEAMTHYYSVKTTAETDAAGNNNYLNDGATGDNALAAGINANASGKNATAVGYNTTAPYERATAMGAFANATSSQATAIGSSASATSSQSTAIGYNAGAHGTYATAVGSSASATSYESTAIGSGAGAHGSYAIAMGNGASATNTYAVAIGAGAKAPSDQATALGNGASATSSQATALGNGASATSSQATAIGSGAYANSSYGIAIGNGASAQYGDYNIAIGNGTSAQNSSYNIAIGNGASAQNGYGTALGYNAKTTAPNGTALGSGASAYYYATALGNNATASSSYALAAGDGANAQVYQAIALGYNAKSYVTGGVALGSSSTANVASGKTGLDPHTGAASTNTGTTWVSTLGAVSVGTVDSDGNATGTRQINGVAAGTQDTDAVNVAQLKAMETRINMHYYSVNSTLSGTGSNYDNSGANGTNAMAAGPAASATAENAVAIGYGAKAEGVGATVIGQYGKATGRYALAFGGQQTDTTAEQANNVASGDNAVSFGERTTASGANATAFGQETKATEKRATAFGQRTQATQSNATAFGINTLASGQNATAFGNLTQATAIGATAFGNKNQATGQYATAWGGGDKKVDNGDGTTKKVGTVASGTYATAFGERTVASGESATAFGSDSTASGKNALAFGENSTAEGENSLAALGGTVAKDAANGAAIGKDAQAKLADTVALGSGSVADRQSGTKGYDAATGAETTQASATWVANANAIAVGNGSTLTRQITGVAAGSLDTDAVNLAQLKEVGKLAGKHTTVSVGGTHATADNTVVNGGNLEMTRTTSNGQANYDVSLNKDIVLGQQEENKGGSITVNSVGTFRKYDDQGNHTDYPMKEAVKIDGTTISVVKHDGSDGDNDQRQVVIGVGQDTGGYVALYDNTGKKPTYIFNAISPGITYLKDNATYPDDANEFGRLEYGDIYNGSTQFIATLDDGLKFSGDQGTMSAVKLNQKLSITGGVTDADSLSTGNNIGVVSSQDGNNGKLELKLNKDLTGLNTVTAGTAKIGNHPADTLKFTQNGQVTETTAPAGDYVTGLDNKYWDTANPSYVSGRAATEDQLAAVSGTINKGLSFTTNTKDTGNTSDNYTGYKVVNRKLGDTISIKAGDADPDMKYVTTNLTSQIAENGDITISMAESPTFNIVTATSVNLNPKDTTTKDQAGNTASARLDAHYRDASLNPEKNVTMADGNTGMVRLHYHDGEGTIHDLATMDDGQIYAGDIKEDGTEDTTGFGRRMNQKTIINGGVKEKDKLTDNNIGVLSNGTDTLTVKLAKNLTKLESVQAGKTTIDDKGLTIRKSDDDSSKNVIVLGDQVAFGDNQVNNMGSGASKITKDDKGNETYEYNTLNNGANIGDVKNIASSTVQPVIDTVNKGWELDVNGTKQKAVTPDSPKVNLIQGQNITITGDTTNTENVTIATADDVRFNTVRVGGSKTDTDYTGGIVIGKQSGGASANPDENDYITGLKNTNWDSNKIQSGRAATEDQLQAVATEIKNGTVKGDVYVTGGAVSYKGEGEGADPKANDGTGSINLTRQNGTDVHIDGLHDYYVTGGTVTDDGTKLELTRNDRDSSGNPQKITVDLSNVLSNDLHLVQNPAEGSEGKYKVDPSTGTVTLKVQNADGTKSSDITIGGFEGLGQGLRFGANKMAKDGGGNPVTNQLGSTINITGAGTKELKDYSGKNLLTSVEQDDQGNTIVHVLMDKNISADGVTVGQAGKDGVAGADGEIGQAGTIGINGKNGVTGDDGKEGITTTVIHTEKGQPGENGATGKPGVDGKDITRIVYQNDQDQVDGKDGSHTVATLDDGLKFSGDDNRVIKKKLNEQLQFVGGADKAKLTQNNIGINELEDGKLTIQLVNTPDLGAKGNLKAGDAHIGWFDGDALNMTKDGTNPSGNKAAAGSYATGLSNTDWNVTDPEYVSGRAATEDQLAKVSAAINNATAAAGKRTVVTVNDKANPDGAEPNSQVGAYGDYSSQNGNLMIAAKKDDEGQMTYNIKLNDQLAIGKKSTPGQDGTDGKFTVETSKGTTVVIGHDGEPGQDGKDGISVKGQDGKDGVTLSVTNGKDGEDGSEGHIGLTGPKGKDGKDASADIHVKNGQNGVDGTDGNKGKDGMDRIVYEDHNGKTHEVATLDDGLKFVGNDGQKVTRKLNETLSIKGGLDKDAVATASSKNLGVRSNEKGDGLEIVMTDTPDFTKVTVGGDKKITIGGQTNSDTKNPANGNYITGLDNTQWDKDHVTENRAATEGQLKEAINEISGKDKGGFGLAAETGGSVKQDLGGSIAIKGDTTYKEDGTTVDKKGNIKTSVDNGAIKVELNKDVDLGQDGSVKAGNTTINKDGVDTNKVTIKDSTISISKDGINAGDKQITNVQSGGDVGTNAANIDDVKRIAGNMKTEINNNVTEVTNKVNQMGDELTQVKQDVKADRQYLGDEGTDKKVNVKFGSALSLTGGAQVDNLAGEGNIGVIQKEMDDPDHAGQKINGLSIRLAKDLTGLNSVTTGNTTINNGGLTVKTGDANRTITVQDGNVNMGGNQIHNVAPGTAPTDAVNVSQLQQTGRAINQLGSSLDKLGTRVDRVGANSAALAALHPLDFDPDDKLDFAVGAGNYSGANAVALGAFYRPNEDVMISLGGSTGGGENMVNLGATFKLGQHNHVSNSRVAMAKEIRDLKALVARQDGEMQQLKTLMNQLAGKPVMRVDKDALFPDIPENHWAYEYVIKLARAGIIEGYEDGQFKGDRMMTRYEFAALLYRAIMAGAAANPDLNQDGTLGKLVKEFDGELKYIRIDVIEKDKHGKPTIERVRTVEDSEKHHGK